ncbi:XkdX family protein [Clostridium butyricum]
MNWFIRLKNYYDKGLYDNEQMKVFVKGKKITEQEYELITGEEYEVVVA